VLAVLAIGGATLLVVGRGPARVGVDVGAVTRQARLRSTATASGEIAVGARRKQVLVQFLLEAVFLSGIDGVAGIAAALGIGMLLTLVISGFSAVAPLWAMVAGLAASVGVGIVAGYWPALRAARLDPVDALRHE
jgi:putative ABC transport system permease protein